ncbi:MAG: hypothetical protein V1784_06520 [bacterium]
MKFLSPRRPPEQRLRDFMRQKKWKTARDELVKTAQIEERNYALWNAVGDAHYRCHSVQEAVEAWRRAAEGYAHEGLYENAIALTRKILRIAAGETELHLRLAELYWAVGYSADALGSLRTYLRLSPRVSESALCGFFRKIMENHLPHGHLLEELVPLFREAKIENVELQTELEKFVETRKSATATSGPSEAVHAEEDRKEESEARVFGGSVEGLVALDSVGEPAPFDEEPSTTFSSSLHRPQDTKPESKPRLPREEATDESLPEGEGRDHYDLGVVYQEMKLWDAAIAEFEQACRDESLRFRAGLALVECMLAKGDPRHALDLLETSVEGEKQPVEDQLRCELIRGEVQRDLGNFAQALSHFEMVRERQSSFGNVEEKIRELRAHMASQTGR